MVQTKGQDQRTTSRTKNKFNNQKQEQETKSQARNKRTKNKSSQ